LLEKTAKRRAFSQLFQDLPVKTPGETAFSQLTAINDQVSLLFQGLSDETPREIARFCHVVSKPIKNQTVNYKFYTCGIQYRSQSTSHNRTQ